MRSSSRFFNRPILACVAAAASLQLALAMRCHSAARSPAQTSNPRLHQECGLKTRVFYFEKTRGQQGESAKASEGHPRGLEGLQ